MSPRDETFAQHEGMVRGVARKLARDLHLTHELDDLVAAGFEGLVVAMDRFDPDQGTPFSAFAYYRVRGAILDEARQHAKISRQGIDLCRRIASMDSLAETRGEERHRDGPPAPDGDAVSAAMDDLLGQLVMSCTAAAIADAERGSTPEQALVSQLERARVRKGMRELPAREQRVVQGIYFEELPLDALGAELRVTRGAVSQIHTKALGLLRKKLA